MKIKALMACAMALLLAGCATAGLADSKGAEGEGALGDLQALAERLLEENPMIHLSREWYQLQLPPEEISTLLAELKPETWEPMEFAYDGMPEESRDGFSLYSEKGGAPAEIWLDYESSTARATLYTRPSEATGLRPAYMSNEFVKEARKYAVPNDVMLALKGFDERVKMQYPYPRVTSFGSLQAIVEEITRGSESWIWIPVPGENGGGPAPRITEATASDLMAALRLDEWAPIGGVEDISGEAKPQDGSNLAINRSSDESDFGIYFYAETDTAKIKRWIHDRSVTWTGGPEMREAQEYRLPKGTVDSLIDFHNGLKAAMENS
jgi:hypothetical protein